MVRELGRVLCWMVKVLVLLELVRIVVSLVGMLSLRKVDM